MSRGVWVAGLVGMLGFGVAGAQQVAAPATSEGMVTLRTGTQLVVLDATVFDKQGRVVTAKLGKDDFVIEQDKRPQAIRSFEAPAEHLGEGSGETTAKVPRTIFILDELNFDYNPMISDVANTMNLQNEQVYLRTELLRFLRDQPAKLMSPTEILTLTHHGFKVLAENTRERDRLIEAVKGHDPGLGSPFRDYLEESGGGSGQVADFTSTKSSLGALWSLALEERGEPGRKNVFWLGWGGPDHGAAKIADEKHLTKAQRFSRQITDLLVAARITLSLIGPGLSGPTVERTAMANQIQDYDFSKSFGFSGYVAATGGQVAKGNDVRGEIQEAANYGAEYYTMSFRPEDRDFDGTFRRIHVSVKEHPEWTVLTKAGYYAMQFGGEKDPEHELQSDLSIATFEAMPFTGIGASVLSIQRVKGTRRARFTVTLEATDLGWYRDEAGGKLEADVAVSAAAMSTVFAKAPLNSHVGTWKLAAPLDASPEDVGAEVAIEAVIPEKTKRVRIVVRDMSNGRIGTVDVTPEEVAQAPEIDTPGAAPELHPRTGAVAKPK